MTSKEMEERSGVPRANIRYYEAEGLLHPERLKNGYRSYSEEDLRTLEKIKLLRRLGVSVEEVRALIQGGETLDAVLDRRLAALGSERASLGRVQAVCGAVRDAGVSFDELDAGRYLQDLDARALPEENGTWWADARSPGLPAADALPTVYSIPRRLLARLFDYLLLTMALLVVMCLAGYNPARANALAMNLGTTVLLGLLEPLCLRLFAATPGKALLGMRLTAPDGKKLSYGAGLNRYLRMLWHGLGCYIPILSLVQLYRSATRCSNQEPQPWDEGVAYTAAPFRIRYALAFAAVGAAVLLGSESVNCACQLPPNRGDLTVAEFAENFNRQADYVGVNLGGCLDETGSWREAPPEPNVFRVDIGEELPGAEQFRYTVKNDRLTAVTLSGEAENTKEWYSLPTERMAVALMAFAWAREDASFWTGPRQDQLAALDRADWEEGFSLRQGDLAITLETEVKSFAPSGSTGIAVPINETDNRFAFTFTMEVEP